VSAFLHLTPLPPSRIKLSAVIIHGIIEAFALKDSNLEDGLTSGLILPYLLLFLPFYYFKTFTYSCGGKFEIPETLTVVFP
jgi:hypothetical protein